MAHLVSSQTMINKNINILPIVVYRRSVFPIPLLPENKWRGFLTKISLSASPLLAIKLEILCFFCVILVTIFFCPSFNPITDLSLDAILEELRCLESSISIRDSDLVRFLVTERARSLARADDNPKDSKPAARDFVVVV